jgi:preprotein translocase subunit SecE
MMTKDDASWLRISYIAFGIVLAYIGFKGIETLGIQLGWIERYDSWFSQANLFGGLLVGAGSVWLLARNPEKRAYHLAAISELRKVTWPSFPDTKRMTIIVAVVVAVFAVILAAFDFVWAWALKFILA